MKVYLAGPMSQIPYFNFPAFREAERALFNKGHEVFSPAKYNELMHPGGFANRYPTGDHAQAVADGFDFRDAMAWNLLFICKEADAIALLPGHENSKGTQAELAVARLLGLPAYPVEELL